MVHPTRIQNNLSVRLVYWTRGILCSVTMLSLSLILGMLFVVLSSLLFLLRAPISQRMVASSFQTIWINTIISIASIFVPAKFVVTFANDNSINDCPTGDDLIKVFKSHQTHLNSLSHTKDIIIANHQIYTDWLYIWAFLGYIRRSGDVKIVMKRSLQFIPIVGLGMKLLNFVFIRRNWLYDRVKFATRLKRIASYNMPYSIIFFPEGTTITDATLEKANKFAESNNLKSVHSVLLPRVTGLQAMTEALSESLDGFLDLTIGYSGSNSSRNLECYYGLWNLFFEAFGPQTLHIHVRYFPLDQIPWQDMEKFTTWIQGRFYEKDELMQAFFRDKQFPGRQITDSSSLAHGRTHWYLILCLASLSMIALIFIL